jgi:hypothetical protein
MELLGLIDWQHACLIPACLATPIPSAFVYQGDLITMPAGFDMPTLPDDYETLSEGAKARVTWELKMAALHKGYSIIVSRHPFRRRLARTPSRNLLILAAKAADACWEENFIRLRYTLAELQCKWSGLSDEPIGFTIEEPREAVWVSRLLHSLALSYYSWSTHVSCLDIRTRTQSGKPFNTSTSSSGHDG